MASGTNSQWSGAEVAVIGGGVAGMAAAFRLQQAGYRVHVYESNDHVGGRTRTVYRDGFTLNQGANVMWTAYKSLCGLVHDAGLDGELEEAGSVLGFLWGGDDMFWLDTEHLLRDAPRFPLSMRSRLSLAKLVFDGYRALHSLRYEDLSAFASHDFETAEQYTRRRLNTEILERIVAPSVKSMAAAPASVVSNNDLLFMLHRYTGLGSRWLAFRGGMGSYSTLMSRRFDVTLSAAVTEVEECDDEVAVTSNGPDGERTARYAACIIAVAAHDAAPIHVTLDAWRRQFLADVPYAAMSSVQLALSKPGPVGVKASYTIHPEWSEIVTAVYEHNKYPGSVPPGKGQLTLYTSDALTKQLFDEDDEVTVDTVLTEAEKLMPSVRDTIDWAHVKHWREAVFCSRVGYYKDLAKFNAMRREQDRLVFHAGDYFAPSSMNTASSAGERAAHDLIAALATPSRAAGLAARSAS